MTVSDSIRTHQYPYQQEFPVESTRLSLVRLTPVTVVRTDGLIGWAGGGDFSVHTAVDAENDLPVMDVDFGSEVVGYLRAAITTNRAVILEFRYGETIEELDATVAMELPYFKFPVDRLSCCSGQSTVVSAGRRAFRFLRIQVCIGTVAVSDSSDSSLTIAINGLHLEQRHFPVTGGGVFRCSDPVLERIWATGANTVKLCMQQFYEDGIKRDGLLWIGDARVECLANYAAFGDATLALKSLRMMAASQRHDGAIPACTALTGGHQHPEVIDYMPGVTDGVASWVLHNYCTDFVGMVWEFVLYTGQIAAARELWPTVKRVVQYLRSAVTLPEPDSTMIITDENVAVKDTWWPSPGSFLCQLVAALDQIDGLCALYNDAEERSTAAAYRATVVAALRTHYQRAVDRQFVNQSNDHTDLGYHVTAFATLAKMYETPAEARAAFAHLASLGPFTVRYPIAGFMVHWVIDALGRCGAHDQAISMITQYWGFMLQHGASTFWEKLDLQRPERVLSNPVVSRCHGWSAGPTAWLSEHLLGVSPSAPGFQEVVIRPRLGSLAWAEGSVPTPNGPITVHWQSVAAEPGMVTISGSVELPTGTTGWLMIEPHPATALHCGINHIAPTTSNADLSVTPGSGW